MATNSALLGFEVDGKPPGSTLEIPAGGASVHVRGFMRSIVPMDHLEVAAAGQGAALDPAARRPAAAPTSISASSCARRAGCCCAPGTTGSSADILDDSPLRDDQPGLFLRSPGAATHCGADADYFLAWIDGLATAARAHPGYNSEAERNLTLEQIAAARKVFERAALAAARAASSSPSAARMRRGTRPSPATISSTSARVAISGGATMIQSPKRPPCVRRP